MTQTAVITGASSGIGKALAQQFAAHGYDVVLVARNRAALEDAARDLGGLAAGTDGRSRRGIRVVPTDLSRPGAATALVEQLRADGIQVDVLVNNAGFGLQGDFVELPVDRQIEMIQLNVVALTELTRLLLPPMLSRRTGGVLNVASTAAFQPGPLLSVYYATKAYVLSFTEGIAEELADAGIKIGCLCPGRTATAFAERAGMTKTNLFKGEVMGVDQVAREGFEAWNRGEVVFIPGRTNRRNAMVVRFASRSFVRRTVKRLNSLAAG